MFYDKPQITIPTEQRRAVGFWFALVVVLITVDQVVKYLAEQRLDIFYNDAFAFSLPVPLLIMYVVYGLVLAVIANYLSKNFFTLPRLSLMGWFLIIAGGLSNVGERLVLGSVRDFIPVFSGMLNVADFYILIGIVLIIVSTVKK